MTEKMPSIFIGHGSPMNAVQKNAFTFVLQDLGKTLPKPDAILCVSAHWYYRDVQVQVGAHPKTLYDFHGFPEHLYDVKYEPPGHPDLAREACELLKSSGAKLSEDWGLDHGAWSVLVHLFPKADVPVFQLSLNHALSPREHYELAKNLRPLREKKVMILGSGNIVHNLRMMTWDSSQIHPWAVEFDHGIKEALERNDRDKVIDYEKSFPKSAKKAVPTPDHYLPLLYNLAVADEGEAVSFPYEGFEHAAISMRAVRWG